MKAALQRVTQASVSVGGEVVGSVGPGLVVLVGVANGDTERDAEYLAKNAKNLEPNVFSVPEEIDRDVARLKLEAMGVAIDKLSREQEEYLASWSEGT